MLSSTSGRWCNFPTDAKKGFLQINAENFVRMLRYYNYKMIFHQNLHPLFLGSPSHHPVFEMK